jgi:hypothetical protein
MAKFNFTIKRVGELRSGTSKTTGEKYSVNDLLLAFEDGCGFISAPAKSIEVYGLHAGDKVEADLKFYTRLLSSGRLVNEIRINSLKKLN